MECLSEFYLSYDDSLFRWNGADLLTRVAKNFLKNRGSFPDRLLELKLHPPFAFFPISAHNITRYLSKLFFFMHSVALIYLFIMLYLICGDIDIIVDSTLYALIFVCTIYSLRILLDNVI